MAVAVKIALLIDRKKRRLDYCNNLRRLHRANFTRIFSAMTRETPDMDPNVDSKANGSPSSSGEPDTQRFEPLRTAEGPVRSGSRASSASRGTLARIRSHNGYGVSEHADDHDGHGDGGELNGLPEKDPHEVGFDGGDSDPACPRSFGKIRKWIITLIVVNCSFCV